MVRTITATTIVEILQTCGLLSFSAEAYHTYKNRLTPIATVPNMVGKISSMLGEEIRRFSDPHFSELLLPVFTAHIPQSYFSSLSK